MGVRTIILFLGSSVGGVNSPLLRNVKKNHKQPTMADARIAAMHRLVVQAVSGGAGPYGPRCIHLQANSSSDDGTK